MSASKGTPQGEEDQSTGLAAADRALLDFAARTYRDRGAHANAVHAELGLSITRYWQRIGALLDDPEAIAYSPAVVNRLRRTTRR